MRRSQGRLIMGLALCALFAFQSPMPAKSAAPGPWEGEDTTKDGIAADLRAYMSLHGVDADTAERELADLPGIWELEAKLEEGLPSHYAGLWIEHDPYGVIVALTNDSSAARQIVASVSLSTEVVVRRVAHSKKDLLAILEAIDNAGVPANLSLSYQSNAVDVRTLSRDAMMDALDPELREAPFVRIAEAPDLGGPSANIYGGLGGQDIGWSGCPSGFTILRPGTSIRGIITAGHCGNALSWNGSTLPFQAEDWDGNTDAQWHTVPGFTVRPYIVTSQSGNLRRIYGRSVPAVGQTVCKYGPVTGYVCGTVDANTVQPSWIPNATPTYFRAANCNANMSAQGDSGGPVFWTTTALGVISGFESDLDPFCFGKSMVVFGGLNLIMSRFNLEIVSS